MNNLPLNLLPFLFFLDFVPMKMPFFDSSKIGFKVRLFALPVRRGKDVIKIRAKFKVIDLILSILIIMRFLKFLFF